MKNVLTFNEFVNESIAAAAGSPVKFAKIRNNLKKYQKALVQKSLNDIDYEKKKAAAKNDPNTQSGVLTAAKKVKDQSLNDVVSSTGERIDKLATTEPLKNVAALGKTKAKIAAAQTSLKAADAEETKQLNLRIKKLSQKAAEKQQELKDYEKKSDDSKETSGQDVDTKDKNKSNTNNVNTDNKDVKSDKKENDIAELESEIKQFDKNIEDEIINISKLKDELAQAKRDETIGKGSVEKTAKIQKLLDDSNEDLAELKRKKSNSKKKLDSLQENHILDNLSVADKFRQALNKISIKE